MLPVSLNLKPLHHLSRTTSARLRIGCGESLFNILANHFGPVMTGARVLDLFAGTGALGLEALSRGAEHATFVDTGVEARALLRENIQEFGVAGQSRMLRRDATDLGQIQRILPCNLVFLDPPYAKGLGDKALAVAYEADGSRPKLSWFWKRKRALRSRHLTASNCSMNAPMAIQLFTSSKRLPRKTSTPDLIRGYRLVRSRLKAGWCRKV